MKSHYEDLTGQRFGRLEAIGVVDIIEIQIEQLMNCLLL